MNKIGLSIKLYHREGTALNTSQKETISITVKYLKKKTRKRL